MPEPIDVPKDDLIKLANVTLAKFSQNPGIKAQVFFKGTCPKCENRCEFEEPNTYYEGMECCKCGHVFPFTKGGLRLEVTQRPDHKSN